VLTALQVKTANSRFLGSRGEERGRLVTLNATLADPDSTDRLEAAGEMVYRLAVSGEPGLFESSPAPLLRFGLKGSAGLLGFGLNVQSVGKGLEDLALATMKKDRQGADVWAALRLGVGGLTLSLAQYSDNVDENPGRWQTRQTQGGIALEINLPAWPVFRLTYANGVAEGHPVGESRAAGRSSALVETLGASLYYYGSSSWDLSMSSAYSQKRDTVHGDQQTIELTCDASGAYRPTDTITMTPSVSYWEEWSRWPGEGLYTGSASLTVGYTPPRSAVSLSVSSSYSRTVASSGDADSATLDVKSTLVWAHGKMAERLSLAFEVGYSAYLDAIYSAQSSHGVSALVFLRLGPSK
jgi:hypothetical protein